MSQFPTLGDVIAAYKLAEANYDTWGKYVIELYHDADVRRTLTDAGSLDGWVAQRTINAGLYQDILHTPF